MPQLDQHPKNFVVPPHLSWSQIESYLACGHQYLRTRMGEEKPYNVFLARGVALADLMDDVCKHYLMKGKWQRLPLVLKTWTTLWQREAEKVADWEKYNHKQVLEKGKQFLTQLWERKEGVPLYPIYSEYEINVEIGGVPFNGRVDIIESNGFIDYKWTRSARFLKPFESIQLQVYAVGLHKLGILGQPRASYLIFDEKDNKVYSSAWVSWDMNRLTPWIEKLVQDVWKGINAGVFPCCNPTKNPFCSPAWCHLYTSCYGGATA